MVYGIASTVPCVACGRARARPDFGRGGVEGHKEAPLLPNREVEQHGVLFGRESPAAARSSRSAARAPRLRAHVPRGAPVPAARVRRRPSARRSHSPRSPPRCTRVGPWRPAGQAESTRPTRVCVSTSRAPATNASATNHRAGSARGPRGPRRPRSSFASLTGRTAAQAGEPVKTVIGRRDHHHSGRPGSCRRPARAPGARHARSGHTTHLGGVAVAVAHGDRLERDVGAAAARARGDEGHGREATAPDRAR
jgi:hypothetical protein